MTLWDYRYKNGVKKIWYAARIRLEKAKKLTPDNWVAYGFASKLERDVFVAASMKDPDFFAVGTNWERVKKIIGFNAYSCVCIDDKNKLCTVNL